MLGRFRRWAVRQWTILRLVVDEDMLERQLEHTAGLVEDYSRQAERLAFELQRTRNRLLMLKSPDVLLKEKTT